MVPKSVNTLYRDGHGEEWRKIWNYYRLKNHLEVQCLSNIEIVFLKTEENNMHLILNCTYSFSLAI